MRRLFLILALVVSLVPATAIAAGVTVMVGAQTVSFGGDLGKYYDIPPGPGFAVQVGFDIGIPIDLRAGRRKADEGISGDELTYDWFEVSPRFRIGNEISDINADWFVGVGAYDLTIGTVEYATAYGGFAGLGIEEFIGGKYVGRFEVKSVLWESDTYNTDGPSLNMTLLFGVKF